MKIFLYLEWLREGIGVYTLNLLHQLLIYILIGLIVLFILFWNLSGQTLIRKHPFYYIISIALGTTSIFIIFIINKYTDNIFINNINDEIIFNQVIIEDASGTLDICINHKGRKKKLRSYPVEFMLIYDRQLYSHKNLRLEGIITNQLNNIDVTLQPQMREMWSPSPIGGIESGWLKGETCAGFLKIKNKKNIFVKFSFFLQDAYGYELDAIYKSWPVLNRVMGKNYNISHNIHNIGKTFYYENFELQFSFKPNTLKVRKGFITNMSNDHDLLWNYYNEHYKRSPNCFFFRSNKNTGNFQVLVLEHYTKTFYNDIFSKKNKTKNLKYLIKIYKNSNLEQELIFFEKYRYILEKYYK